jgi:ribosomal-protein-alanine N-acetyltransferase
MTAAFPHPYTADAARTWVTMNAGAAHTHHFAIQVEGALAGGAGSAPRTGERRGVAEFGYWLAPAYWGRGIATEAAQLLASHALSERGLRRLEAYVFAPNMTSARYSKRVASFAKHAYARRSSSVTARSSMPRFTRDCEHATPPSKLES